MALLLFSNNARTTLAGAIAPSATTANLAGGTGSLFPAPTSGQYFEMSFTDAATGLLHEIVYVTGRSGDVITITRGQEGTAAQAWQSGDIAANWWTAGSAGAMVQVAQLQQQAGNYAVDSGTANAYVISLTPTPPSLSFLTGVPIRVQIQNANTGASTLTVSGLAATTIVNMDGSALQAGQIVGSGRFAEFMYDGTNFELINVVGVAGALVGTLPAPTLLGGAIGTGFSHAQSFTTPGSASFTVPSLVTRIGYRMWGGGGGGGASSGGQAGAGGGGGEYAEGIATVTPGQVLSMNVAFGGTLQSAGQSSTITGISTAVGGGGASGATPGSGGGGGTGGYLHISGGGGGFGTQLGALNVMIGGAGGSCFCVPNSGYPFVSGGNIAGAYPGGGSSGQAGTGTGAAGAAGLIILMW